MIKFQRGEQVRVVGLPMSEWHGASGVVVNTMDRIGDHENEPIQECAVQFLAGRRWFQATDLVRTVPDRALRFFRGEVLARWDGLTPDDVTVLNGTREELSAFLQQRYGFGLKRALAETDSFISDVEARMRAATTLSSNPKPSLPRSA